MPATRRSSAAKPAAKASAAKSSSGKLPSGLYPSIAVSDFANFAGHLYAAHTVASKSPSEPAIVGFLVVALAAFVGTLRFGFSENTFSAANGALADLATYMGLPLSALARRPSCSDKV